MPSSCVRDEVVVDGASVVVKRVKVLKVVGVVVVVIIAVLFTGGGATIDVGATRVVVSALVVLETMTDVVDIVDVVDVVDVEVSAVVVVSAGVDVGRVG